MSTRSRGYVFREPPRSLTTFKRGALGVVLLFGALQVQAATLTLVDALDLAQNRSRQLVAQDAAAGSARHMAVAAQQLPDPTVRASIDALPINGPDRFSLVRDNFTMRTIGVSQEWVREDKRRARGTRYEREAETAEASRALALTELRRDTAIAWLDRYYQERIREVLLAQRDETRLQAEAADAAYRGGRGAQADVFAARTAIALIEDRIDQTERQVRSSKTQLARWVGDAAQWPLAERPSTDAVPLNAEELEARFDHHPEIAVMFKKEAVAQAEVDLAIANKRADWSVSLTYAQRGPSYSDFVFLGLSIPLQWDQKNRQEREVAAKLATLEQLRAEREEATRRHVAETLQMLQEWQTDRHRLERYETTLVPLATERAGAALATYRGGSGSLSAVLEARRGAIDTRIDRLRLAMETDRLWAQLEYLIPADHATRQAARP